ncbi:MOSC domain-containing protein [Endozoicomonas sp. 8E]|uniref:MOSC domain-containing protein n=1 Tax=Endozoicomonas sp. 8E TaxID=3035692 RepID=UPI0029392F06|nr:MOSC domain-containing protein [Endozoicomonas sp. 8E]WOG26158.1 MOSC domain-containing protein [Endozoicomonas sp. 8E]
MKLTAICIGKTKRHNIRGHDVTTAYLKSEVQGPVKIHASGIKGNEVAVHNDHIYAVSSTTYDYWKDRLGGSDEDWPKGRFAENLIIDGLDEVALAVGDVLRIGDEVVLSVSGPRIPCFKVCWRLGQPDSFIPEFAISGHSGIYLNVVKTGTIIPGDHVQVEAKSEPRTLVLNISKALFADTASLDQMQAMSELEGLSPMSTFFLTSKIAAERERAQLSKGRWSGSRALRVKGIRQETADTKSVWLEAPDGTAPLAGALAGQFLAVKIPLAKGEITRLWSLSDYQDGPDHYRITIKRSPSGPGSAYMHETLAVGDSLRVSSPLGQFTLARGNPKPVVLFAGGIGLTPLLAMLKAHTSVKNYPPVFFFHAVQDGLHQAHRDELDQLGALPDVTVIHIFSRPNENDISSGRFDYQGYVTKEIIAGKLDGLHIMDGDKRIDMPPCELLYFLCGPQAFQTHIRESLLALEANAHQIYTESFGTEPGAPPPAIVETAEVTFLPDGVVAKWDAGSNLSMLELAEVYGLTPPNACRMGVCHTCTSRLVAGRTYYDREIAIAPPEGDFLLCCSRPGTEKVTVTLPVNTDNGYDPVED